MYLFIIIVIVHVPVNLALSTECMPSPASLPNHTELLALSKGQAKFGITNEAPGLVTSPRMFK